MSSSSAAATDPAAKTALVEAYLRAPDSLPPSQPTPTPKHPFKQKISYDYLGDSAQPYVAEFVRNSFVRAQRQLEDPAWTSLLNKSSKRLQKEICEGMSATSCVRGVLRRLARPPKTNEGQQARRRVFCAWDLCCGKGFTSVCLHAFLREELALVKMVDKSMKIKLGHMAAMDGHVRYERVVVRAGGGELARCVESTLDDCRQQQTHGDNDVEVLGIVVGVHLCTYLAEEAIAAFRTCDAAAALVLVPCCLGTFDTAKHIASTAAQGREPDDMERFQGWVSHLVELLQRPLPGTSHEQAEEGSPAPAQAPFDVSVHCDELMMSQRNTIITAVKRQWLAT